MVDDPTYPRSLPVPVHVGYRIFVVEKNTTHTLKRGNQRHYSGWWLHAFVDNDIRRSQKKSLRSLFMYVSSWTLFWAILLSWLSLNSWSFMCHVTWHRKLQHDSCWWCGGVVTCAPSTNFLISESRFDDVSLLRESTRDLWSVWPDEVRREHVHVQQLSGTYVRWSYREIARSFNDLFNFLRVSADGELLPLSSSNFHHSRGHTQLMKTSTMSYGRDSRTILYTLPVLESTAFPEMSVRESRL